MGGYDVSHAAETSSQEVLMQQQVKVSGTVVDAQGEPVPGAKMNASGNWNAQDDVWTIPVWWDSDQQQNSFHTKL